MENNLNSKLITNEEEIVLADNNSYEVNSVSTDYSEDVFVPFETWVTGQYGHASRKYYFTANASSAHINGSSGKYIITVQGSEEVTLHLYCSCTYDEIYTKTGKSFETTDMPRLEYNKDYHFLFTRAMNSNELFYVRIDYLVHSSVDDDESDGYNENYEVPVQSITIPWDSCTMYIDDIVQVGYDIYPTNATNQSVTWSSSDPEVASVHPVTGCVTTKKAGTTTIIATTDSGGLTASCVINVILTDEQLAQQIVFYFSLLSEYSDYAYLCPMEYAVLKNLDSEEAAIAEQTELLHSIQLLQYILLENKFVANSPIASSIIAKHILTGEEYDYLEQAEITQDIRAHFDVFDKAWKKYSNKFWLELAQLLLEICTFIPYINIPASAILFAQGIVGKDLTGRQMSWWERALEITGGIAGSIESVGLLSASIKNIAQTEKVKILNKVDNVAEIAGDHAASELAYALRTGRASARCLDETFDSTLINKVIDFRDSFDFNALRNKGNVAMANVNISGVKTEWFAHSKINNINDISPAGAVSNISLKPTDSVFEAIKVGEYTRNVDTEYKILSDIANAIGDNYSISGEITLFTELPPCDSCSYVVGQFLNKYKNIEIEVIHNSFNTLLP